MSFKGRLSRLAAGPPPVEPVAARAENGTDLAELRRRMELLLGREATPAEPPAGEIDWGELPFERSENEAGPITLRRLRLATSHHVGRIPVDSARDVASPMLALLALDPSLAAVDARGALYLDTETTGLGGAGSLAFLVGLSYFDETGQLCLEQLLLASPAEEAALLFHVRQRLNRASLLVTFNGKSFDLPLLEGRALMNGQPAFPGRPHLDLLHVARRLHKLRLKSVRLKLLEAEVLGFDRSDDDIAGADIAPLYGHFLRTGRAEVLRAVVEHNAWDVISMAALVGLYGEPMGLLHPTDLLGVAETARRSGDFAQARDFAEASWTQGAGPAALLARARIDKARGDKARALLDFEQLSQELDDPVVRLELCKLYEHHARDFQAALALLGRGVAEDPAAVDKRRARLETKKRRSIPGGRGRRR